MFRLNSLVPVALALLLAATIAGSVLMQWHSLINPDVAMLSWAGTQWMAGHVYGVDILEINPPLGMLIYVPGALLAPLLAVPTALKLWIGALTCLSVLAFWHSCAAPLRLPLAIALAGFAVLAFPGQFGQREHLALLLTAPYVAGHARGRGWALLSGVMAGVGFALKPYFLIALVLVFATRRKLRGEELAIVVTGASYAVVLLGFFRPYLFHFLPEALAAYASVHESQNDTVLMAAAILAMLALPSLGGPLRPQELSLLAATLGFLAAAVIQNKGFNYHFQAAWGFLTLYLVSRSCDGWWLVARISTVVLCALIWILAPVTVNWRRMPDSLAQRMALLLPEIDRAASFQTYVIDIFPAAPTLLYTPTHFTGLAPTPAYANGALDRTAPPERRARARALMFDQARRELQRAPELVIFAAPPATDARERPGFSFLGLLTSDARFAALWRDYAYDKRIGKYDLYRRRPAQQPGHRNGAGS